jgi:hypothetical protein
MQKFAVFKNIFDMFMRKLLKLVFSKGDMF